jgi:protocatechuate 3,4-dioxygenase beta subunit/5-hydroxyisourate hydrolase-like protein (transthyretin family)
MFLAGQPRWPIVLALFCATASQAQTPLTVPATKADATAETCTLSGIVVAKADGAPLKGATVHLWVTGDRELEHTIAAKSSADGRFLLKNVPAGNYHLKVSRNGYFDVEYGQQKPTDPGAIIKLQPGQNMSDLLFRLGRAGVISGRIFDVDGEPMAGVMVEALRNSYQDGRQELTPVTEAQSNDLGEFRLFGLAPGRYFVSAQQMGWDQVVGDKEFSGAGNANEKGYARVYYPSVLEPDKASPLTVKEGEEVPSVDFLMKEIQVYRIRGRVLNLVSKHTTHGMQVMVLPRKQETNFFGFSMSNLVKADGSFELPDVAPGEYTVLAMLFDEGKMYSTQQDVDVGSSDVDGLVLSVNTGVSIPGRITWEGKPSLGKDEGSVALRSVQRGLGSGETPARIEEGWQFTLKEVPDGTFRVQVNGLSEDCYIKEVKFGDTVLPDVELRVKGASANLEITVSSRGARVQGQVLNQDNLPVVGAWVAIIPEEEKRKVLRLYKSGLTDQYGHFEIRGLAPGKYKVFSWEGVEKLAWEDPDFLQDYEDKGQAIELLDGDRKSLELNSLSAKDAQTKTE